MNARIHRGLLLLALAACADDVAPGPPFRAYVIEQTSVDPVTGRGEFVVEPHELTRIHDIDALTAPEFRLVRGGALHVRAVAGSVVMSGEFKGGSRPEPRYVVEDGTIRARDYSSLALFSTARQFERVFDAFDAYGPYDSRTFIERLSPPTIYFEPTIEIFGETSATAILKFNAFYHPDSSSFGIARRSSSEDVPLSSDYKVISHEVGHAIWSLAFDDARPETCEEDSSERYFPGRFQYEYALRGLDEGFADWHAFTRTGSVNPLANQSDIDNPRNLREPGFAWDDLWQRDGIDRASSSDSNAALDGPRCFGGPYCIGTLFAHALYMAFERRGGDPEDQASRAAFTSQLVRALEQVKATLQASDELPRVQATVKQCEFQEKFEAGHDGAMVKAFWVELLRHSEPELRDALCAVLPDVFQSIGRSVSEIAECPT